MLDLGINIQEATLKTNTVEPAWAVCPINLYVLGHPGNGIYLHQSQFIRERK